MNTDSLPERLNWRQACELLGCKKDAFYRLIREGKLESFGVGTRCRWVKRCDCEKMLALGKEEDGIAPI